MAPAKTQQFQALAGLRGIAALAVVQWHGQALFGVSWLPAGYLAVDFFFLLSGWVLAHAYDRRFETGLSAGRFLALRLIRLYPAYVPALLLAAVVLLLAGENPLTAVLAGLIFLPAPLLGHWLVTPAWSLAAELLANAGFGVFHRRLTDRVLLVTIIVAAIFLAAAAFGAGNLNLGATTDTWAGMLPRVFFSFPLGVLLHRHRDRLAGWSPAWSTWPSFALLAATLAIPAVGQAAARDLLIVIVALPLVLLFASNGAPRSLSLRVAAALGAMSYPLYLLHRPLMQFAELVAGPGGLPLAPPLFLGLVALLLLLSLAVDRYYDEPVRRWLVRRLGSAASSATRQIA